MRVDIGSCSVGHPTPWSNADAALLRPPFVGVFDGVSAAPQSRRFARAIADSTAAALARQRAPCDGHWRSQAVDALREAAAGPACRVDGASTACLIRLDLRRSQLSSFNLGDSGYLVLEPRNDGRLVECGSSVPRLHPNGAPFQLAGRSRRSDDPTSGLCSAYPLRVGQLVLLYTDGLSDNLPRSELVSLTSAMADAPAAHIASRLAAAARRAGMKPDDTTVVCVKLTDSPAGLSRRDAFAALVAAAAAAAATAQQLLLPPAPAAARSAPVPEALATATATAPLRPPGSVVELIKA